ncbi:sugar ABC transporter permease [Pengzhenrongella sp.]|jgi:raffinose/stachyose/melibiose transport system permease protein|uniref:carbohydrate ABC transporter permease n=1 Tax=Pengzhenrongella sp. TaxID=2888820 RepID=UPI002F92F078
MSSPRVLAPAHREAPTPARAAAVPPAPDRLAKRYTRARRIEMFTAYLFILPTLLLFVVFSVYPFARTVELSFTSWDGLSSTFAQVGLDNYLRAFHDSVWWGSMGNGIFLAVIALILMQGLGLLLAVGVDRKMKGQTLYRTLFYLPPILSGIVVATIWKWLLEPNNGVINATLDNLGLGVLAHPWLGDPKTALWAISIVSVWQGVGYPFLLFLAGLQGISGEIYEAARMDGATGRQIFVKITLPLLRPVIGIVSVLTFLGAMQTFNLVVAMTKGGPGYATEVPILHIYRSAFGPSPDFGYASALSIIFGVLLFGVSMISLYLSRRSGGDPS